MEDRGIVLEPDFSYSEAFPGGNSWNRPPLCKAVPNRERRNYRTTSHGALFEPVSVKNYLGQSGPVVGCFTVYEDLPHYSGGIYHHVSGTTVGGHCVLVVGFSDPHQCWICKNSWGADWGENGFFRINYSDFLFNGSFFPCYTAAGVKIPGEV
jgi:C1A family cysteine protease